MDYELLALEFHEREPKGKIHTGLSKPLDSQMDLAIAYSPGVAGPCREIHKNPDLSYRYTGRGNLIGVITNGTAVLGLGDIGPFAAKPVMEGKAALFKKFADIDVFDLELNCQNADEFCTAVKALEPTFGGINLEDIKAPECFYIEERLRATMSIPVFHDDQHGTAIIASAAFINALEITGRTIDTTRVVFSGGGAAAIATAAMFVTLGVKPENILMVDSQGVLFEGREKGMNPYKAHFARKTSLRTLAQALVDADAFVGVSQANVLDPAALKAMAPNPIIFALANPDPEIKPDLAKSVRPDAIIATGRSDFPNQVNNVLGFPFIFRGALDVQARTINDAMKLAAAEAIANLAKEEVPEEVLKAYTKNDPYTFGRDYLIPKPVDPRVLLYVAPAVAKAAMDSGVARLKIDLDEYRHKIEMILGPTRRMIRTLRNQINEATVLNKKRPTIVIPHGHDSRVIKAASQIYYEGGDINIILLGSPSSILDHAEALSIKNFDKKVEIVDPLKDRRLPAFCEDLYTLRQRKGVSRLAATELLRNHNYYAAMMVRQGFADAMMSGLIEPYVRSLRPILEVIGCPPQATLAGVHILAYGKKLFFIADGTINIDPSSEKLADIAETAAAFARKFLTEPIRVALLSFSSFGSNNHPKNQKVARATQLLGQRNVPFAFDGEIQADIALNAKLQESEFPFCQLGGSANVLVFPDLESANICYKVLSSLKECKVIGPILLGPTHPANILERSATTHDLVNMIYITAFR
jgi:malate dehydrogenase (oxaloacetate-decarboxylating)(NADP+)